MGAITWGADVAGPATASGVVAAAAPDERAIAQNEGRHYSSVERAESGRRQALQHVNRERLQADREGLEGICEDFRVLGLAPPALVEADVADEESLVRRAR